MGQRELILLELGQQATDYYAQYLTKSSLPYRRVDGNFERLNQYLPNQYEVLILEFCALLDRCASADSILIPNITLHEVLDEHCPPAYQGLPVLHPLRELERISFEAGMEVLILGSLHTMRSDYIASRLKDLGLSVVALSNLEQSEVDEYRRAINNRQVSQNQAQRFEELISQHLDAGFTLVLACTELSLVLNSEEFQSHAKLIDLAQLQLNAARRES